MTSERDNWMVSSYTGGNGNCVEVSPGQTVLVRDTKDRGGAVLSVPVGVWQRFTATIK